MKLPDYYAILGVDPGADQRALKSAYRRLARQYHPDVAGKRATKRFLLIREAYEILSNPERRRHYDSAISDQALRRQRSGGEPVTGRAASATSGEPHRGHRLVIDVLGIRIEVGVGVGGSPPSTSARRARRQRRQRR